MMSINGLPPSAAAPAPLPTMQAPMAAAQMPGTAPHKKNTLAELLPLLLGPVGGSLLGGGSIGSGIGKLAGVGMLGLPGLLLSGAFKKHGQSPMAANPMPEANPAMVGPR